MRYDRISFQDFEEHYINKPDGYFPVYAYFDECSESGYRKVVKLDMICEWRLHDGKVRFLQVPFDTKDEFEQIIGYLRETERLLSKAIDERIDELYKDGLEELF